MKIQDDSFQSGKAFSLVEMLSVIAVIGIISPIAIPGISNIRESAERASAQRNAQNLASVFVSAQAAGLDLLVDSDLSGTISNIVQGGFASEGVFNGSFFGLPGLNNEEQADALAYLRLEGDTLKYQLTAQKGGIIPAVTLAFDPENSDTEVNDPSSQLAGGSEGGGNPINFLPEDMLPGFK